MRWFLLVTFALTAITAAFTGNARAAVGGQVEFCPAAASVAFPVGTAFGTPARTFAYDLSALAPRTVTAAIVADTSAGWYGWTAGNIALSNTTRNAKLRAMPRQFHLMPYVVAASPTLAVAFPVPVMIRHLWVTSAQGITCDVPGFDAPSDTAPPDPSDVVPVVSSLYPVAVAAPSQPPFASTGCDQPFSAGTVTKAEAPDYPVSARLLGLGPMGVAIEVALDPAGNLIGAWVYAGSGDSSLDRAALDAARKSKYSGSISYCRPVNGTYLFLANFMPGG